MKYRRFTLVLPYYDNPNMFREQQKCWAKLSADIREALDVIVVDDCSPTSPAVDALDLEAVSTLKSFRMYRTGVDVRWNWLFCRNLGAEKAETPWLLLTDMDHVIPEATWRRLMRDKLDELNAYRLSRVEAPKNRPCNPHPNTWIMTRHMFLNRIGGYDERMSGFYGTDGQFQGRVALWAQNVVILSEVAIVYGPNVIPDAYTTRYGRREPQDIEAKQMFKVLRGETGYTPSRLTFPWSQVYPS